MPTLLVKIINRVGMILSVRNGIVMCFLLAGFWPFSFGICVRKSENERRPATGPGDTLPL